MEVLFWQEMTSYKTEDYLSSFRKGLQAIGGVALNRPTATKSGISFGIEDDVTSSGDQIKEHWRDIICEWAYNLVDHFDLPRDRVSVFANLLDRFLQKYLAEHPEGIAKKHFQLLALTILYLTVKLDCHQGFLSMEMMIHLSREKFTKAQMVEMEKEVLRTLEWKLHPPTSSVFLRHFLLLLDSDQHVNHDVIESARFYMELAVLDYQSVPQRPSRIALAALLNAMDQERLAANSEACNLVQERQYNFLLSLVAPSERESVDRCRSRLTELFHGLAADDMEVVHAAQGPLDGRMASPVSVAHGHPLA